MAVITRRAGEVVHEDGRHELEDPAVLEASPLFNADLAPIPVTQRRWGTYNYMALWVGISHCVPTWLLASGLVALGMSAWQALITIGLGNLIVLVPILLNSHAGTKYGIPFPVFARAPFGTTGANLAALLRALVACGWFGIQTWIGGQAIFVLVGSLAGGGWSDAAKLGSYQWTMWLSFAIFWAIEMVVILRGIDTLRRFESWAAPFVLVMALALLVWLWVKAGGAGPILSQPSKLGWGHRFWPVFFPSLMGMIAFWATLSLNIPDFSRFGRGQRQQIVGQAAGLPTTMTLFSLIAVLATSASVVVYGKAIWDPVQLTGHFSNPAVVLVALFSLAVATIATNVAANVVSPSYDFCNLLPKWMTFRRGAVVTGVIGILIQPWRLVTDPSLYIYTWLDFYGGMLGAIAGVLVADYWLYRRTRLDLAGLYRPDGPYAYRRGWNWRALTAAVVGMVLAVGGAWSAPGAGPFPHGGLIPFLQPLYNYSWIVGFGVGLVLHAGLSALFPHRERLGPPAEVIALP